MAIFQLNIPPPLKKVLLLLLYYQLQLIIIFSKRLYLDTSIPHSQLILVLFSRAHKVTLMPIHLWIIVTVSMRIQKFMTSLCSRKTFKE